MCIQDTNEQVGKKIKQNKVRKKTLVLGNLSNKTVEGMVSLCEL